MTTVGGLRRDAGAPDRRVIRGDIFSFRADPFAGGEPAAALSVLIDGAVLMEDGVVTAIGPAPAVLRASPDVAVDSYPGQLVMAGFVDAHAHYPQTGIIASYGKRLIEWLDTYTFPAELAFGDGAHARRVADTYLDLCLANGITTASVYCTVHPQSVDALFEAAQARGLRMVAGKVMMDRNAPAGLLDTAQTSYDQSKALIARWHGRDRLTYAITPRFAPTSTPEQLAAAGTLWRQHPSTLMQTHLAEQIDELAWVGRLYPDAADYLAVYERFGLVGCGANFGHAIHLSEREAQRLADTGSGISHCPTSNTFIGSGLFDLKGLAARVPAVPIGLASDVGGGSSFSMLQTMKAAYEIAQLRGHSLHPVQAFYLASLGAARVLRLSDRIGNLVVGGEADIVVLDPASTPVIRQRMATACDLADVLFVQMMLGDDRAVRATYAAGRRVHDRDARAVSA